MKTETKILIVAIIMIMSVGPMDYFFSTAPKTLPLPNATNTTTSYSLSGNVTGTIMNIKPYIYYVGVSSKNSKTLVDSIIGSIPEITNYSLDVSLNPYGSGYQYTITVPLNDTSQIKAAGFRLVWRLSSFFDNLAGSIPFVQAKVALPQNFSLPTDKGVLNITTIRANFTVDSILLYSKQPQQPIKIYCPQMVTSLNYSLLRVTKLCDDNDLNIAQPYMGLSLFDVITIPTTHLTLRLEAYSIGGVEFSGNYHFAGMDSVSINGLESQTNSTISLTPLGNDSTQGNFTIKAAYTDMAGVDSIKTIFKNNNFTIEKEYKYAVVLLPHNVTINGRYQELYNIAYVTGQMAMSDEPGFYDFDVAVSVIYGEATNVVAKKFNLS
jgi:hypothetical protein